MADAKVELEELREESDSLPAAPGTVQVRRRGLRRFGAVLVIAVVLVAAAWLLRRDRDSALPPPRVVPLTSMRGSEWTPALSPDGEPVAFSWDGGESSEAAAPNRDIWLKLTSPEACLGV